MTPHRFRQLAARGALVACLAVGAIACGDDDDDTDTGAEEPAGDTGGDTGDGEQAAGEPGCQALVDFEAATGEIDPETMSEEELGQAAQELRDLWTEIQTVVPEDQAATADELAGVLDDLVAGDPSGFQSDETFGKYLEVLEGTVEECGFAEVSTTAVDYAFEDLPETVDAGTVALKLDNQSEGELHEIVLFKKAEGETRSAEEILNDPASEEEGPGEFAGFAFAEPGEQATGIANLTPGEYIAVCFVPVGSGGEGGDEAGEEGGEEGPPHFTQGMFAELTVE